MPEMNWKGQFAFAALCALFCVNHSTTAHSSDEPLSYSEWTKVCVDGRDTDLSGCLTGKEGRIEAGSRAVAAVVIDRATKPLLRVILPLGMQAIHGTRVIVDKDTPVQAPYVSCQATGCMAEYELTTDLRRSMNRGKILLVQAINSNGAALSLSVPLAGLESAMRGQPRTTGDIDRDQQSTAGKRPPPVFLADPRIALLPTRAAVTPDPSLIYAEWVKFCLKGQDAGAKQVCFTGNDGRLETGEPVIAAVLIEPEGEPKKILRVTLPIGLPLVHGTRLIVDANAPAQSPYVICFANGCMSDYEVTPELLANMKKGRNLVVQAINSNGAPLKLTLPLPEFAKAYDGPPTDPKVFEENQKKLQEQIQKRATGATASNPAPQTTVPPATSSTAPLVATAQPAAIAPQKGRRIALVIGNSKYKHVDFLPNPQRDAAMVADALKRTGFAEVTLQTDLGREALSGALQKFLRSAQSADWAVVYYAGHGMEIGGINYLIPIDATLETDREVEFQAVSLNQVLSAVASASKLRLVVLDACRINPFASSMKRQLATRAVERGFTRVEPNPGTLVVYAAQAGEVASDGNGTNSPFSAAFAKNIQMPGIEINKVFRLVRDDVQDATQNRQTPYSYGSLTGREDFYFVDAR